MFARSSAPSFLEQLGRRRGVRRGGKECGYYNAALS